MVLEISCRDGSVLGIKMLKYVVHGYIEVVDIIGLAVAYKHFVDSAENNLLEGFVDGVVLFEQFGSVSEGLAFSGDDGGGGAGSDDCGGARID